MKSLCIIPARGGSKRIPRKNIKNFLGKPIIAYSIETALQSNLFDEVMVSTDDEEIAEIAREYGAIVPFLRSNENASDFATTFDVLEEVLGFYKEKEKAFHHVCCLYPCTPLMDKEMLEKAYKTLLNKDCNSVFPVIEYSYPIQRALSIENGLVSYSHIENSQKRSQDMVKKYHDAGQYYFMKSSIILNKEAVVGNDSYGIIISELDAQDIDNETDWELAKLKFKLKNEH